MPEDSIACFVRLLENKVIINGNALPVLTQIYPHDNVPSITLDLSGLSAPVDEVEYKIFLPLDEDNPFYDPDNPNEQYIQKTRRIVAYRRTMTITGWFTDIDERDSGFKQVMALLNDAVDLQFNQCANYDILTHKCSTTGNECDARTVFNTYSAKGRCPYLNITDESNSLFRGPVSLLLRYNIERKISIRSPDFVDDLNISPVERRFIITVDFVYNDITERGTVPTLDYETEDSVM